MMRRSKRSRPEQRPTPVLGSPRGAVRKAGLHDLDRLAALWTAMTRHHAALDPIFRMRPNADGEIRELLRGIFRDRDAEIFVYALAEDLPGMCIVRIDRAPPIMEEVERAEITDLGVREEMRRRGIGSALARAALAWVADQGVRRVEVQVAHVNREAQAFWRSQSFDDLMDVLHKRL